MAPKEFSRAQRVESLIQVEIAKILQVEMHGAPIGLLTVTSVKVSPDLSHAKIYVVTHDEQNAELAIKLLNDKAKTFRHQLAKKIDLRIMPTLRFHYDESIAKGDRMTKLFNEITRNN
jgi:ribosome-binding factor A